MTIEQDRSTNRQSLSDTELRAALYFAVGVTSESGDKAYRLVVAGDNASTPRLEPADNSGYSIGTIQTDLGQHYQPNVRNGENVPRDLVAAYQDWARENHPDWVLNDQQTSQTIADLGRNGRQINAQNGRALDATVKSHLDTFLASDAGITWVHQRDVAQIEKLMRNVVEPLQQTPLYQNASQDDQVRLTVMLAKAYNQNEALSRPMLDRLERGDYQTVASVSAAIDGLSSRRGDYFESGRDKALKGAEIVIALRNTSQDNPLHAAWEAARDNALSNPTELVQAANGQQLVHAYPAVRELFIQHDRATAFIDTLERGGTYVRANAQAGDPGKFSGRGLIASGNDFAIWNSAGAGHAFVNNQWRSIERSELTRTASARGVLDVGINGPMSCERLIHADPNTPALRPRDRQTSSIEAVPQGRATHVLGEHPLFRDTESAVRRLDASLGRPYDQVSERMAASLACLAREHGLNRVDHVVLSRETAHSRQGENVFVVQGDIDNPSHRLAQMKTQFAAETSVEQSVERFLAFRPAEAQTPELELVQKRGMMMS